MRCAYEKERYHGPRCMEKDRDIAREREYEAFLRWILDENKRTWVSFNALCPCRKRVLHHPEDSTIFQVECLLDPYTEDRSYELEVLNCMDCDPGRASAEKTQ